MNDRTTRALHRALLGVTCAVGCATLALAAPSPKPPASSDSLDNPAQPMTKKQARRAAAASARAGANAGGEGGIAGTTLIWDNGPIDTGQPTTGCTPAGTSSVLQNLTPLCLNVNGFANITFTVSDDFTLTQCAEINKVTVFLYATGATTVTATGGTATLHSGEPWATTSNVVATSSTLASPPSFTTTYRHAQNAATSCTTIRRIQQVEIDTSSWPVLPPGTYWLSWNAAAPAGFCPPVTLMGLQGKPGANSKQGSGTIASGASLFNRIFDTGVPACVGQPPAPGAAQDMPFLLHGVLGGCGPCNGDTDGDSDVDADDLTNVILQWGSTCPCTGDVDDDNDVDSDDLTIVILNWGPCGGPTPPPVSTGACCVGTSCSVMTFGACNAAGGTYFGDGANCSITGGCVAPANDNCAGATSVALGTFTTNTTLATNSPEPVDGACAFQASRDVWYALQTTAGTQYTVDTLQTTGLGSVADTVLVVYNGTCGALVTANCNDDVAPGTLSSLIFAGDGNVMYIRVGTFVAAQATVAAGGNITIDISSP